MTADSKIACVAHQQHRCLAQRRHGFEPVGFVGEIDVASREGHLLLVEHDRCALHVGAQRVADQDECVGHGSFLHLASFGCTRRESHAGNDGRNLGLRQCIENKTICNV